MLKKITCRLCFLIVCLLTVVGLSACCSPSDVKVTVVFENVDPNMGIESYVEDVKHGDSFDLDFVVPEGYDHSTITAKLNDKEYEFDYELSDISKRNYAYATDKKISLSVKKVTRDITITFDMTQVRRKQFKVYIDDQIINVTKTKDTNKKDVPTNLKVVTINPEYLKNLTKLDEETVLESVNVENNYVMVEYGSHIALVYTKNEVNEELSQIYSTAGAEIFANDKEYISFGNKKYVKYDVATRGRTYYNEYVNGSVVANSRIYYIGKVQEQINLYKDITDYKKEDGFVLENDKNKFSLLTNKQDYASDMLDIKVFVVSEKEYNLSNYSLDQIVGGPTIERVEKYSNGDTLKNPDILYEFNNRYDVYNMYIGDDIENDELISASEKNSLSQELYLRVDSSGVLENNLNIYLLTHEKQSIENSQLFKMTLNQYSMSSRGEKYYKIDKDLIQNFITQKVEYGENNEKTTYISGNAILSVQIDQSFMREAQKVHEFPYSTISYPTYYGSYKGIDYDYEINFYILNSDGSKDYGFVEMQKYEQDMVYFRTDKLWKQENNEWVCLNNLYINILGPDTNEYNAPSIQIISLTLNYSGEIVTGGIPVENPEILNGIKDYPVDISGQDDEPYYLNAYNIQIGLGLSTPKKDFVALDFSNLEFYDQVNDALYVTNDNTFYGNNVSNPILKFERVDYLSMTGNINVRMGSELDVFYVFTAENEVEFDSYIGYTEEGSNAFVGNKIEDRKISESRVLKDIAGNEIKISINGRMFTVYVMYQTEEIYRLEGDRHFVFNA